MAFFDSGNQYFSGNVYDKAYFKAELITQYFSWFDFLQTKYSGWSTLKNKSVGYLDYTDTVPDYGTEYQATWYSDEDCTVQVLPANFVSGNRYYVKLTAI